MPSCKHEKRNSAVGRLCMQVSVPQLSPHVCITADLYFSGSSDLVSETRYGNELNAHI